MRVVEKLQAMPGEGLAGAIEDRAGLAAGLFVKRVLVGNPGAADVLQAERPGLERDVLDVIGVTFKREMTADRFKSFGGELFFEFFRGEIVGAGQFDMFDAEAPDLLQSGRDVLGKLLAQAVKLEADRPFKTRANAGGMFFRCHRAIRPTSQPT